MSQTALLRAAAPPCISMIRACHDLGTDVRSALQRSADILSVISDVVWMVDEHGVIIFVSDAVRRVLKYTQV